MTASGGWGLFCSTRTRGLLALGGVLAVLGGVLVQAPGALAGQGCPNEQLRVEDGSTGLPDCRAYELVSPAGKDGGVGDVFPYGGASGQASFARGPMQAAPLTSVGEEDAVTYQGEEFYQSLQGDENQYVSRRSGSGWSTVNVTPPQIARQAVIALSGSLGRYLVASGAFVGAGHEGGHGEYRNLYVGEAGVSSLRPLITGKHLRGPAEFSYAFPGGGLASEGFRFAPAASDLSRVFFEADDALLPGSGALEEELNGDVAGEMAAGEYGDYLYESSGGKLALVNVLPDGRVARHASLGYVYREQNESSELDLDHVVSGDGSRVFWSGEETGGGLNLYVREGGVTTQVDAAVGGGGLFLGAMLDGSRVFFAKGSVVFPEGGNGEEVAGGDLYEYNLVTRRTTDLSNGPVQGMVGTSSDGEYVYFVSPSVLSNVANERGGLPVEGAPNLFVSEPDPEHPGQHTTRFIATLTQSDNLTESAALGRQVADWTPVARDHTAEVSPNGLYLAFGSHLPLTGVSGGPNVFLYSAASGGLACVSCYPSGAPNAGALMQPPYSSYGQQQQREVLDDGSVFFSTEAALVPQDVNGQEDVYEWEDGAAHLISSGTSEAPSVFADATASGSDVFFTTAQPLVGQDGDGIVDMYDARVEGGLPAPSVESGCATTEGCSGGLLGGPPVLEAPGTASLSGVGNVAPPVTPVPTKTAAKRKSVAQVRAEALARALRACRKRPVARRAVCVKRARGRYGAAAATRIKSMSRKGGK